MEIDKKILTPWGEIGYITFKRTYARRLDETNPDSATEEFEDVIKREIKACREQLNINFTKEEEEFYLLIFSRENMRLSFFFFHRTDL